MTFKVAAWALALLALAVLAASVWFAIGRNLDFAWTSIRLAPAFALARGEALYSMPDRLPWVMVGYGPLYPVAYLPCVFARHPVTAVSAATLLAHFYILAPVAALCSLGARRLQADNAGRPLHWIFTFLLFALITTIAPSLTYVTAGVHADAPAIGLFLLACYSVLRCDGASNATATGRGLAAAGVLAGLSACCKLNLAAGVAALCVWVVLFGGWRRAAILAASAALAVAVVYGWAVAQAGFDAVWLNVRQPARMPWFTFHELGAISLSGSSHEIGDKVRTFVALARSYLQDYGIVAVAVVIVTRWSRAGADTGARVVWFFLVVTLLMLPASIASLGKYGGDVNSRALVSLPLALAALFALAAMVQGGNRRALLATYGALAGMIFVAGLSVADGIRKSAASMPTTMGEAYAVVATDPARWYFPYDPLAHLLAEDRLRPNIDVVYSYAMSGMPVDETVFRSAMPENLRYIAVPPALTGWGVIELRRLLPEYMNPTREMNFPRHQVYER
ncbi:MAG: hypothetical protein H0W20_03140 [Chthoniobacterales bacterium]|nr:hypothetical protein [Chthoniobacterales bacterium]